MVVQPVLPTDHACVGEIARAAGVELDVAAELARSWAKLWVTRPVPDAPPIAFLLAWDVADELHLIDLVTHPAWRRRGAASALIDELLAHARGRRARLVLLEVRRSNRAAIRLYRSRGFAAIGLRRGYYRDQTARVPEEDAVEMVLELDPRSGVTVEREDEL
jgi:ribosomal-protein-alanine N-acetyltransferase